MRSEFAEMIVCPACGGRVDLSVEHKKGSEIWSGLLTCSICSQTYPVVDGIPHLYVDDEQWAPLKREAAGWVQIYKEKDAYDNGPDALDFRLPYVDLPPWNVVSQAFDLALSKLQLAGGERVLDLGAGRAWAAKQFAVRGCQAMALDIVADPNIGLGRAFALMQEAGTTFDLLVGDASRLPLPPNSLDLVFCSGTLHHAQDLALFLSNIARVLRPGGRLCAMHEPALPVWQNESRRLQQTAGEELAHGINEHLPRLIDYLSGCEAAGLRVTTALPSNLWQGEGTNWPALARQMGARWGGVALARPIDSLRGMASFIVRRLAAVGRNPGLPSLNGGEMSAAAAAQLDILHWCGGDLLLLAEKEGGPPSASAGRGTA